MNVENVLNLITQLRDAGVIDLVGIVISTVIPLAVLFATLRQQKRQNLESLKQQDLIHRESMKKMDQEHREAMQLQEESNRIHAMPFFILKKDAHAYLKQGNLVLTLSFINAGNGTAIHVTTKYIGHGEEGLPSTTIYNNGLIKYTCACPFNFEKSVVRQDEVCSMDVCCARLYREIQSDFSNYLKFSILYSDMYGREYEQIFGFYFQYEKDKERLQLYRISNPCPCVIRRKSYIHQTTP